MPGYRFEDARKAGVTDTDIVNHLESKGTYTYKFAEARKAGVSDTDIVNHLMSKPVSEPSPSTDSAPDSITTPGSEETILKTPETVSPMDVTATEPTRLALGKEDVLETPQYMSGTEFGTARQQQAETTQAQATESSFPVQITDPETGEVRTIEPKGLEDDILSITPVGKFSLFRVLPDDVASKLMAPTAGEQLSPQAKVLLNLDQNRISEEEAVRLLKGVPEEDQVITLAESMDLAKKYFSGATRDDSILSTKLGGRLEARKQVVEPFVANKADLDQARQTFSQMKQTINEKSTGQFNTNELAMEIDELGEVFATDPGGLGASLKQISFDLKDNISAGQALEVRENINAMLRKPAVKKSYKTSSMLNKAKDRLDNFIGNVTSPEHKQLIDREIGKYRETINNYQLGQTIDKNTKADYAVDWQGVVKDIDKEGIRSSNTSLVLPLLKLYTKKFHNDKYLAEAITPDGGREATGALGLFSKAVKIATDSLSPVFNRSRYTDLQIQRAIAASIRKNNDYIGFVDDVIKIQELPEATVEKLQELKNVDL
jgi:hypothetical protein